MGNPSLRLSEVLCSNKHETPLVLKERIGEHIISFTNNPFYDMVSSTLTHTHLAEYSYFTTFVFKAGDN